MMIYEHVMFKDNEICINHDERGEADVIFIFLLCFFYYSLFYLITFMNDGVMLILMGDYHHTSAKMRRKIC